MNSQKLLTIILGIIGIISMVFLFIIINVGDEAISAGEASGSVDTFMYISYIILFATLAIVLFFVVKGLFTGNIKKTLMSVGAFVAIILVSYILSSGTDLDLTAFNNKGLGITEAISKNVGAGLIAFYILGFLAIVSMVYSGFNKISK
ncbi:MAG: hypothetical protein B7Z06_01715 [Flavobacteriales bacterium 32-35-8]|nr:MAG: hypothetical protein B7Z06_01715 [Flavobacteriales bacterium 32-35-8]